jgi:hypothetical protein
VVQRRPIEKAIQIPGLVRVVHEVPVCLHRSETCFPNCRGEKLWNDTPNWVARFLNVSADPDHYTNPSDPTFTRLHNNHSVPCEVDETRECPEWVIKVMQRVMDSNEGERTTLEGRRVSIADNACERVAMPTRAFAGAANCPYREIKSHDQLLRALRQVLGQDPRAAARV